MTKDRTSGSPAYRGDVQGMRAVAVLAVIAAHAQVPHLAGGFIGVDVFFVISGFLITALILTSIVRDEGRFSLGQFYARRARRILPAASLVLVVVVVASIIYLNFLDALDLTRDAVWAAFFAANVRFATQGVDYFALEDSPSPLQHYWSLAVEEQFYVVWPIVVAIIVLLTRRWAKGRAPLKSLALAAAVIGGASLAWSVHQTVIAPTAAYFSSFTRAWELAAGALVAIAVHGGRRVRWRLLNELLGWGGLIAIGAGIVLYDDTMAFPGYEALLPVLATVAILLAATDPERRPSSARLLEIPPLRRIGDWSYSLYLWHWPLIVIPEVNLGRNLTPTETLIAVALTLEFGYLTYRFVEQPFRNRAMWRRPHRGLVLYPLSLALVLPVIAGGHWYSVYQGTEHGHDPAITAGEFGMRGDILGLVEASVEAARSGQPIPSNLSPDLLNLSADVADVGDCNYMRSARPLCRRGDVSSDKVIVVTGDSHARAWIPAFEHIAQEAGYATYYLVKQQCTAAFVDPGQLGTGAPWPECQDFHAWVTQQVAALHPDLLVVATSPPPTGVYLDGQLRTSRVDVGTAMAGGFDDMFAAYKPLTRRIVLLADVPRLPVEPSECLAARGATLADCTFAPTSESEEMRAVSVTAAQRDGVQTIDPTPWLCFDHLCPMVIGSTIDYRDRGHISATRAAELWEPLGEHLRLLSPVRDPGPASATDSPSETSTTSTVEPLVPPR